MRIRIGIFLFLIVCACGFYSFSGGGYPGISSIAIPLFEDRSAEFQIREKLTEALIDKFLRDNTLRLVEPALAVVDCADVIKRFVLVGMFIAVALKKFKSLVRPAFV